MARFPWFCGGRRTRRQPFGLVCFAWGEMGSQASDASSHRERTLFGGLAYSDDHLRRLFAWMTTVELRRMEQQAQESSVYGENFLWAGLFTR